MSDSMDFYGPSTTHEPVFEGQCTEVIWLAEFDCGNIAAGVCSNDLHALFWGVDIAGDPSAADIRVKQLADGVREPVEGDASAYRFPNLVKEAPLESELIEEESDEFHR